MQLYSSPPRRNAGPVMVPQDVPVYKIDGNGFYCDDELHPVGAIVAYDDEPNPDMIPLNALALKRMRDYLSKLDVLGRKAAEKNDKLFVSVLDAFEASYAAANDSGRRSMRLDGSEEKPVLGGRRRGRPRLQRIEVPETPEVVVAGKSAAGREAVNATTESGFGGKASNLND